MSTAPATVYPLKILDIGCPENSLQSDTFHLCIGETAVERWCLKRVTAQNPNVYLWLINSSSQNSQQGSGETKPKKKSVRGGYTCCVPGCYSNTKRDQELSFHKFPKDESMKLKWSKP